MTTDAITTKSTLKSTLEVINIATKINTIDNRLLTITTLWIKGFSRNIVTNLDHSFILVTSTPFISYFILCLPIFLPSPVTWKHFMPTL